MNEHTHTPVLHTTGNVRFVGGEVVDTLKEMIICSTCGEVLPDDCCQDEENPEELSVIF